MAFGSCLSSLYWNERKKAALWLTTVNVYVRSKIVLALKVANIWKFLPPPQTPLVFTGRGNEDPSSWCWNPGLCGPGLGLLAHSEGIPPVHSATATAAFLCHATSPPLPVTAPFLPSWMDVSSVNPRLSNFHTAQFSDGSGCYSFWDLVVIICMVAQGGNACLPVPLSWLEVPLSFPISCLAYFLGMCTVVASSLCGPFRTGTRVGSNPQAKGSRHTSPGSSESPKQVGLKEGHTKTRHN